ncbi:hypothetical protein Bca52824_021180 [Brassica carinata]|uniref:non-reducing end alpha-L-arabinofuranosidase n=1 Tax=Brassica carinata TaxID=52824 RepID=A0A8X7VWG8_BRACI|nr:hypothetical protein Bca52824_021180 [Brassica carinata]
MPSYVASFHGSLDSFACGDLNMDTESWKFLRSVCILSFLLGSCFVYQSLRVVVAQDDTKPAVTLQVNASNGAGRLIPETLFGIFFEEINHAGAGGLWAELVSNRGFEAGGQNTPSNIWPWSIVGDQSSIYVATDRSSCFERNKIALRMDVLCDSKGCPSGGVGVYNPGYWGMNIEEGKKYKVALYVRSAGDIDLSVSLTSSNGSLALASEKIILQLTTTKKGSIWIDQVSAMPVDTYKGHGFRNDLYQMMADIKPRFIRFPGGCFVEGEWLSNAFRWKETVGPWEERPGHFGDVWKYWTDDGLGHFEFFQKTLAQPPYGCLTTGLVTMMKLKLLLSCPLFRKHLMVLSLLGDANSTWGSVRAAMGRKEPFELKYVAIGNEDCGKTYYRDIKIISNCDGSSRPLDHPADYYDFHIYTSASNLFSMYHQFDRTSRKGPKAFVSEYAVTGKDAGKGSLLAALAEAAFLIGLEKNSDIVEMASYAPLFVNTNDRRWNPDAIVFNSSHLYGTPSYWVQRFFAESSGSTLHTSTLKGNSSSLVASAITWNNNGQDYIRIKAVNFGATSVNVKVLVTGLDPNVMKVSGSKKTILTSTNVMDENSFAQPEKVAPHESLLLEMAEEDLTVVLPPHSFSSFDLLKETAKIRMPVSDSSSTV